MILSDTVILPFAVSKEQPIKISFRQQYTTFKNIAFYNTFQIKLTLQIRRMQKLTAKEGVSTVKPKKSSKKQLEEKVGDSHINAHPEVKAGGSHVAAQVFSITRDLKAEQPYHLDGDVAMYSEQNINARQQLKKDPQVVAQLSEIVKLYQKDQQGRVSEATYKIYQKAFALILRPDIQAEQLNFIVEKDWELDSQQFEGKYLTTEKLLDGLFQMVDHWTIGNQKQQYVAFCKLLKKKITRAINQKE